MKHYFKVYLIAYIINIHKIFKVYIMENILKSSVILQYCTTNGLSGIVI